jgi:hypothetical protein
MSCTGELVIAHMVARDCISYTASYSKRHSRRIVLSIGRNCRKRKWFACYWRLQLSCPIQSWISHVSARPTCFAVNQLMSSPPGSPLAVPAPTCTAPAIPIGPFLPAILLAAAWRGCGWGCAHCSVVHPQGGNGPNHELPCTSSGAE